MPDSSPSQCFTAVLLGLCFSPGSTDFNKNGKGKSLLTFLGEHNPKPEKPTLKDYTSFQDLSAFTQKIKRILINTRKNVFIKNILEAFDYMVSLISLNI